MKTTSKGDAIKRRQPEGEIISMELGDLNGRQPQWKTALMEEDLN